MQNWQNCWIHAIIFISIFKHFYEYPNETLRYRDLITGTDFSWQGQTMGNKHKKEWQIKKKKLYADKNQRQKQIFLTNKKSNH